MARRGGQTLQSVGNDGTLYSWYRRPYVRRVPTVLQLQQRQQQISTLEGPLAMEMLNPQQTKISELGELILTRCFQSLPVNDRFNMEHVSRLFRAASKRSWIVQNHVIVVPEVVLNDGNYSIDGRRLFRILMKRCARYTVELTIHAMAPKDRIFRLLHMSYRVENLCLDSLTPLCGSEIKEVGERLPLLKTLIIRNCRIHFSFVRHFNSMLEQLKNLQVLVIIENINFRCELESLPRTVKILCIRDFQVGENLGTILRNARQRSPNISALFVETMRAHVLNQVLAYDHISILSVPFVMITPEDVVPAELFPVNYLEQLTALELGLINQVFIVMRLIPEMFPRLEHLKFAIKEDLQQPKMHEYLEQIIKFPVLRSFEFSANQSIQNWINEELGKSSDTMPLLFQGKYIAFIRKLFEQKKLEHLQLNFPLSTEMTIDLIKTCPNLRSVYFHNRIGHLEKNQQDGEYFIAKDFIRQFTKLKKNEHPPNKEEKKINMLERLFKGTQFEKGNEWILCQEYPKPSHVLKELIIRELGEEYINHPTQLFDIVRN